MPLLDWVNRNQAEETASQVPFHLLKFQKSFGDTDTAKENLIIQGDNLQILKSLLPLYGGKVKCVFIDPPYNSQSAFEHYDDKLEHAQWLTMMYPRLQLLKELLTEDGSIWITLDDNESHYLKVMCDEIFGRKNFHITYATLILLVGCSGSLGSRCTRRMSGSDRCDCAASLGLRRNSGIAEEA